MARQHQKTVLSAEQGWTYRAYRGLSVLSLVLLMALTMAGCTPLPSLQGRQASVALTDTADTKLGKAIVPLVQAHPGKSGIIPLSDGRDAFAARAILANAAQRTLDVQNYIWHADLSGTLLFEALHRAADRGVRVRLLLDDNNTAGLDGILASLDAHPNIEVRLFNPFTFRKWRILGYLTDFSRLNRRMHNKSYTADNQITIVGGRNVGDEYFDAGQDIAFVDLDALTVGPVVKEVSRQFDEYWASDSAYPASRILEPVDASSISELSEAAQKAEEKPGSAEYLKAIARQSFLKDLFAGSASLEWASTQMFSDDPAKGLGKVSRFATLPQRLQSMLGEPKDELFLVSSYFVPTEEGVAYLTGLTRRGVKVTVLTNALEATDVVAVHAGYAKWRKPLLQAGVNLFELKKGTVEEGSSGRERQIIGKSSASLHAKTFAADRTRVFIGSFNFDPRSARLNTEMGFTMQSGKIAQALYEAFANKVPERAYRLRLDKDGNLEWVEHRDGKTIIHHVEPGTGPLLRLGVDIMSLLPLDWML